MLFSKKNNLILLLLFAVFSCNQPEVPTIIEGQVLHAATGLPVNDVSVRIFGIREAFMGGNAYITADTLEPDAIGKFNISVSHPEVSYLTVLVFDKKRGDYYEATKVNCSPYACLDLPAGRKYELEIKVED